MSIPTPASFGLKPLIERISIDSYEGIKSISKSVVSEAKIYLQIGLEQYINREIGNFSKIKTLVLPEKSVPIKEIYVPPLIGNDESTEAYEEFFQTIKSARHLIITAIAGQGKSLLLKNIFLDYATVNHNIIPVFIELRDHLDPDQSVDQWILSRLLPKDASDAVREFHRKLLSKERFLVLLDGYDEVPPSARANVQASIMQFAQSFDNCTVIVTSRPMEEFQSWHSFQMHQIEDYDIEQAKAVVGRIPVDEEIKSRFLKGINDEFVGKYGRLLSNPLLIGMMFLTFWKNNHIPEKEHLIYEKSFETFYTQHDNTKFLYKRRFYSNLAEDDFKSFWQAFCFVSYVRNIYRFTNSNFGEALGQTNKLVGLEVSQNSAFRDFSESICMLIRDGDAHTYLHRSYQEYFAARQFIENEGPAYSDAFASTSLRFGDDMHKFAEWIDREKFRSRYLLPSLDKFLDAYDQTSGVSRNLEFLSQIYTAVEAHDWGGVESDEIISNRNSDVDYREVIFELSGTRDGKSLFQHYNTFNRYLEPSEVSTAQKLHYIDKYEEVTSESRLSLDNPAALTEAIAFCDLVVSDMVARARNLSKAITIEVDERNRNVMDISAFGGSKHSVVMVSS